MSQEVVDIFSQYIRGLAKVCVLYGFTAVVLFAAFRLPYALFLGIAAGILYAVPYVGPGLAMSSAAIISLTAGKGVPYTGVVVAAFIIMHVTFDYGVTPRVVGGSVGLHPLVNVFALMVGATMFGVPGMLLAVPVAASIQRLLSHFFPRLAQQPVVAPEVAVSPTPDENVRWEDEAGIQPALD
jgi:predicted PurR-regulated permease PerM